MTKRTIEEEQLRQLRQIKAQLNPAPVVAFMVGIAVAVILTVIFLFFLFVALPGHHGPFFPSSSPPAVHHARPVRPLNQR
jgi:hypothetical protein